MLIYLFQDSTIIDTVSFVDTSKEVINNLFSYWFTSLVLFSAGNVYITNKTLSTLLPKVESNIAKQGVAIGIGLILALIGWFAEMGMFEQSSLADTITKGLEVGFTSNAMYVGYKNSKEEIQKRADKVKAKNIEKIEKSMDKTVDSLDDKFKKDLEK